MMDGTEPTPGFHYSEHSVEGRLLGEFTHRLDAVLERRISNRRLEQKLSEIKRRAVEPSSPEDAPPGDLGSTSPDQESRDTAWTTAAAIVATANEVRNEIVHSAETEADEIRTAARKRAEQLVAEAVLEAGEIRAAARKEAAALLAAAQRKAEPSGVQVGDHDSSPRADAPQPPRPRLPEQGVSQLPRQRPRLPEQRSPSGPTIPIQRSSERTEADR